MEHVTRSKPTNGLKGFTLIELMVVIAIIGVLMTMLFPAVSNTLSMAKRMNTQSILKNIGTAVFSGTFETGGEAPQLFIQLRIGNTSPRYGHLDDNSYSESFGMDLEGDVIPAALYDSAWADEMGASGRADKANYKKKYRYISHQWTQTIAGQAVDDFPFRTPQKNSDERNDPSRKQRGFEYVPEPSSTWAISEVDWPLIRDHYPRSGGSAADFIAEPLHETVRCAVFFDCHVEAIPVPDMWYLDRWP